jgi:hypothetical protein
MTLRDHAFSLKKKMHIHCQFHIKFIYLFAIYPHTALLTLNSHLLLLGTNSDHCSASFCNGMPLPWPSLFFVWVMPLVGNPQVTFGLKSINGILPYRSEALISDISVMAKNNPCHNFFDLLLQLYRDCNMPALATSPTWELQSCTTEGAHTSISHNILSCIFTVLASGLWWLDSKCIQWLSLHLK